MSICSSFATRSFVSSLVAAAISVAPALAAAGLTPAGALRFLESSDHPIYTPAADEQLGRALAAGDWNGDGVDDLAIGIPRDRHLFATDPVGEVQIRYGVAGGGLPDGIFADYIWQGGASSVDPPESLDRFGCTLASGNFNGDAWDDLAVGVCHEDLGDDEDAGAVEIRYGGPAGLTHDGVRQFFHQDSAGIADDAEDFDRFGEALATGDFNGDGFADLAIGVPLESVFDDEQSGLVHVLFGGAGGLSTTGADHFDSTDLGYNAGDFFHLGQALAAGDFNGDDADDLAVGSPGRSGVGAVFVLDGGAGGLDHIPPTYLHQSIEGVEDVGESGDSFGAALAAARFGFDAYADLAVGVPLEDTGLSNETVDAGCVHLFFGTEGGLVGAGSQYWVASNSGVPGGQDANDRFGWAVAGGDFDGNGRIDLVIGVPGDPILAATDVGELVVLPGTTLGPSTTGSSVWSFASEGVPGRWGPGDQLGYALVVGDFDGSGHSDLAAGAPFTDTEANGAGSVLVLRGALFADDFENGTTSRWATTSP